MGQKVRLFQDFVDTGLNRIVVITGSGQTVLSVGAITPEATDDLTGKLVHGLRGLGVYLLKICSVDRTSDGVLAVLALVDDDPRTACLKHIPGLGLHPLGDVLAAVVLCAGDLHQVSLFE